MPSMTPGKYFQAHTSDCFSALYHPGSHALGVELLMLLLALQQIIVPLDTGSIVGSVFTGTTCNVRRLVQVLFPWKVQEQHPPYELCGEGCLPGWPRVLVCKLQKFCCCYVLLQFNRDKRSSNYRHLVTMLIRVCYSVSHTGNLQFRFQEF